MNAFEIKRMIGAYLEKGLKVFNTSSFQTQSVVLLKILSKLAMYLKELFLNLDIMYVNQHINFKSIQIKKNLKVQDYIDFPRINIFDALELLRSDFYF